MSNWNADHFRITVFSPTLLPSPAEVLPVVFGVPVSASAEKKFGSESSAEGEWQECRVEICRQPGRYDFFIKPLTSDSPEADILPGGLELLNALASTVAPWIASLPNGVIRMALSGRAMLPVVSRDEGYDRFAEKVRLVSVKKDQYSDLNFQVNIPVSSNVVDGLKLNRVTAWAVAFSRMVTITPPANSVIMQENFFLHCVPDISTDAERVEPLSADSVVNILDELTHHFQSLLEGGIG